MNQTFIKKKNKVVDQSFNLISKYIIMSGLIRPGGIKRNSSVIIFCLFFLFTGNVLYGQLNVIGEMMSGGVSDAEKVIEGYMSPFANAMGSNLSAGWYNTAKPHKLGGFDLTVMFNMSFVPDEDKLFDLSQYDLIGEYDASNAMVPTAAGDKNAGADLHYYQDVAGYQVEYANYRTPRGTGLGFIPTPMAQVGIGLIKGTEIIGRYMPKVSIAETGELGLWGIGVKHSIKQWIPAIKKIPVLHLSVIGGYTKFSSMVDIDLQPDDLPFTAIDQTSGIDFSGQSMNLDISSFTASLLVSANLPVVCFYGGLGFASTNTNLVLNGYYPIPTVVPDANNPENSQIVVNNESVGEENPLDIEIKNKEGGTTKPRMNVGMRLKFGVITLHGDYTYSNYSIVTAGLGISFR